MLGRLGKLLHYFHRGYPGGDATADDRRLIELIEKANIGDERAVRAYRSQASDRVGTNGSASWLASHIED
jgi:hypothetical protein